jgi:hypothetical protein
MIGHHGVFSGSESSIYSGTVPMVIPQGGNIQRHMEVHLPEFSEQPTVLATVFSNDPANPGSTFVVVSVTANTLYISPTLTVTQVIVDAQNTHAHQNVAYDFLCSYLVVGKPVARE